MMRTIIDGYQYHRRFPHIANVRFNPFNFPYVYIRVQIFVTIPNFFEYFHEPDNGMKSHTS